MKNKQQGFVLLIVLILSTCFIVFLAEWGMLLLYKVKEIVAFYQ